MAGRRGGRAAVESAAKAFQSKFEPYRVHMTEPLRRLTKKERYQCLVMAKWNPVLLDSRDVFVDLLSDSGCGSLSKKQWAAIMIGDESYAGSPSYDRFKDAVSSIMPNLSTIFPVHQGRAAEKILAACLAGEDRIVPSNTRIPTLVANLRFVGITPKDLRVPESSDPDSDFPFKGNMDVKKLRALLEKEGDRVPAIVHGIANNGCGGQPASMANIRQTAALAREFGKIFIMNGGRFAENAMFIKLREKAYATKSIPDICMEMFSQANVVYVSAKKDVGASIGGWLALDDTMEEFAEKARQLLILTEGYPTYGGLAGRDLDAIAVGIGEAVDEDYLGYRVSSMAEIAHRLEDLGIPILNPVGGSSIHVNAGRLLPHLKPQEFPGISLANALYLEGGVRAFDVGSLVLGTKDKTAPMELTRLSFPRRLYTASHIEHVIESLGKVAGGAHLLPGYRIVWQHGRSALRAFTAHLKPIP